MSGSPAFDIPPDLYGAGGSLRGWYTDPAGAVVQFERPTRATREMTEWLVGPGLARLRGRFPQATNMILVLDLSLMEGRDPAARVVMLDAARKVGSIIGRRILIPPVKTNAVYLTTLHAASALLSAVGINLEIAKSLADVIAEAKLKPAGPVPR